MKKKKYDRPFVEVLTLETSGGMMKASPNFEINLVAVLLLSNVIVAETKKYINNLDAKDDTEIENDDMGYKSYD